MREELVDFYQNILGFQLAHQYELSEDIASQIFGLKIKTEVFIYSNGHIDLELFLFPEKTKQGFSHICINMENRKIIEEKCEKAGYPIIKIEREEKEDLLFVMDRAENKFELKNW